MRLRTDNLQSQVTQLVPGTSVIFQKGKKRESSTIWSNSYQLQPYHLCSHIRETPKENTTQGSVAGKQTLPTILPVATNATLEATTLHLVPH